jgi:hypothetical protein
MESSLTVLETMKPVVRQRAIWVGERPQKRFTCVVDGGRDQELLPLEDGQDIFAFVRLL